MRLSPRPLSAPESTRSSTPGFEPWDWWISSSRSRTRPSDESARRRRGRRERRRAPRGARRAADGAGLGNKFLANIRECDAIVHVVRCFDDDDVIHVDGKVDPLSDISVINFELALAARLRHGPRARRSGWR